jgi:hypothetical protein
MSSQDVFLSSQCVPQHVPNSSTFYPIFFAISFTLENLYIYNPKEEVTTYLFWDYLKHVFKKKIDGPNKDAHHIINK